MDGKSYEMVRDFAVALGDFLAQSARQAEEIARLRAALRGLVDALAANDEDGLTEFAEPMTAARAALQTP